MVQKKAQLVVEGTRVVVDATHLDAAGVEALRDFVLGLGGRLEVDLGNVRSLCITCLGKLFALDRRVRAAGGHLTLLDVTPDVYEALAATHLTEVLEVSEPAVVS